MSLTSEPNQPSSGPYRAWLLDLDGTLYASSPVKIAMVIEILLSGGWPVIRVIHCFRRQHEELRRQDGRPEGNPYRRQVAATAARLGLDAHNVEAMVEEWLIRRPAKWITVFRRRALLTQVRGFKAQGGHVAVVSDYPARYKLRHLQLLDCVDAIVASGEDSSPSQLKPWPEGCLIAARLLDVPPHECLVIGDRIDTDGAAARQAGMGFKHV